MASSFAGELGGRPVETEVDQERAWVRMRCPIEEASACAQEELRDRLSDAIRKVAVKLRDPKAIFRDTLVSNLTEILALVPDLNLADDPQIADLARQAGDLVEHDAATLRDDPIARANTASRADEICSLFSL